MFLRLFYFIYSKAHTSERSFAPLMMSITVLSCQSWHLIEPRKERREIMQRFLRKKFILKSFIFLRNFFCTTREILCSLSQPWSVMSLNHLLVWNCAEYFEKLCVVSQLLVFCLPGIAMHQWKTYKFTKLVTCLNPSQACSFSWHQEKSRSLRGFDSNFNKVPNNNL